MFSHDRNQTDKGGHGGQKNGPESTDGGGHKCLGRRHALPLESPHVIDQYEIVIDDHTRRGTDTEIREHGHGQVKNQVAKNRTHKSEGHRRHNQNRQTVRPESHRNERINDKQRNRVERRNFTEELGFRLLRPPFQDLQPRIHRQQLGYVAVFDRAIDLT